MVLAVALGSCAAGSPGPDEERPYRVRVTGRDYAWHYVYPGQDGRLDTGDDRVGSGDLGVPTGRPVVLELRSEDYIYTLSLPHVGANQVAVPDLTFEIHLDGGSEGVHPILGDQLCGYAHPELVTRLVIRPPGELDRWLADHTSRR